MGGGVGRARGFTWSVSRSMTSSKACRRFISSCGGRSQRHARADWGAAGPVRHSAPIAQGLAAGDCAVVCLRPSKACAAKVENTNTKQVELLHDSCPSMVSKNHPRGDAQEETPKKKRPRRNAQEETPKKKRPRRNANEERPVKKRP